MKRSEGTDVFLMEAKLHALHSFFIATTFSFVPTLGETSEEVFSVSSYPSDSWIGTVGFDVLRALVRALRDEY